MIDVGLLGAGLGGLALSMVVGYHIHEYGKAKLHREQLEDAW